MTCVHIALSGICCTCTISHLYLRVISKEHVELGFDIYISTSCVTLSFLYFKKVQFTTDNLQFTLH